MKLRLLTRLAAAALALHIPSAASAATQIIVGTELTGATGVNVGGTLYDVEFIDGTCIDLFGGCTSGANFTFGSDAAARVAAQALLDQVLTGIFDTVPARTAGCEDFAFCFIFIPFAVQNGSVSAVNAGNGISLDGVNSNNSADRDVDLTIHADITWARFTPAGATAVPEPASWMLMLAGFGAVGFAMRRRREVGRQAGGCLARTRN